MGPSSSSCRSDCRPSAPRRCASSRRPTRGAWRRRATTSGHDTEALYHEVLGAFELAASRDGAPIAVRAFNPTRAEHGYEPGGSVLETNTEDLPFLVDSVSAELQARGLGIVRVLHPILGTERAPDGGSPASFPPMARPRPNRSCTSSSIGGWRPRTWPTSRTPCARCWPTCAASCATSPPCAPRRPSHRAAREGAERYDGDEVAEVVAFLEWLARENFIFLGARDYELRDGALRVVPGSGLGLLDDEARSAYAKPVRSSRWTPACASARSAASCCWSPRPTALSPVHRRVRMTTSASAGSPTTARSSARRA